MEVWAFHFGVVVKVCRIQLPRVLVALANEDYTPAAGNRILVFGRILHVGGNWIASNKPAEDVVGEAVVGGRNRRCAAAAEQAEEVQNPKYHGRYRHSDQTDPG